MGIETLQYKDYIQTIGLSNMCSILSGEKVLLSSPYWVLSVSRGQHFTRVPLELRLQISGAIRPLAHILHCVLLK